MDLPAALPTVHLLVFARPSGCMPQFLHDIRLLLTPQHVLVLVLTVSRLSGLAMIAPVLGSNEVPMKIRALLVLALSLVLVPVHWESSVAPPVTMLDMLTMVGTELILGFALGAAAWLLMQGIQLGGMLVSQASGLSLADVFNPALDESTPVVGNFLYLLATAIFLAIGGHRAVVAALLESFSTIPLGQSPLTLMLPEMLLDIAAQSFLLAVRVAGPGLAALLLATVVLGMIGRALPQLNVMIVGVGMNAMLAAGVLALSMGTIAYAFRDELEPALQQVFETIGSTLPDGWIAG